MRIRSASANYVVEFSILLTLVFRSFFFSARSPTTWFFSHTEYFTALINYRYSDTFRPRSTLLSFFLYFWRRFHFILFAKCASHARTFSRYSQIAALAFRFHFIIRLADATLPQFDYLGDWRLKHSVCALCSCKRLKKKKTRS